MLESVEVRDNIEARPGGLAGELVPEAVSGKHCHMSTAADQPRTSEMPEETLALSGPIASETIPALIHSVLATRETGILRLEDARLEKSAYVRDGRMVFARSSDPDDRLGEILLRNGYISIQGFERCTYNVTQGGRRLGELLVDQGVITPAKLAEGVREQVSEIIRSMFLWTRGQYSFVLGGLPTTETITLEVNTYEIIRNGIEGIRTWSRIRDAVGGLETRYLTIDGFQQVLGVPPTPEERQLLEFCSPPAASVGEICDTLPGNHFEICRCIWALLVMGTLTRVT